MQKRHRARLNRECISPGVRGGRFWDARKWAIASARRDRDIVSAARLILVISKRVSDLSADPPDACSRAAGQLTRRDARLLQSPRSGSLVRAGSQAAEIAQDGQRGASCWFCPKVAVRAVPARLLLLCLLLRSCSLTVDGSRHSGAAGGLHRRGRRVADRKST